MGLWWEVWDLSWGWGLQNEDTQDAPLYKVNAAWNGELTDGEACISV